MMKRIPLFSLAAVAGLVGAASLLRAADSPTPPAISKPPIPPALREELQKLTPPEREARIREFREKQGLGPLRPEFERRREEWQKLPPAERDAKVKEWREKGGEFRDELEKRREELRGLSPDEREAKIKEWREKGIGDRPGLATLSSAEREARRKVLRERLEKQLGGLRKKKADGSLNDDEKQRLERMEDILQRFAKNNGPLAPSHPPEAK